MSVGNNSKFVRGKKKAREYIEHDWDSYYDMQKLQSDGWDYLLKVPYQSEEELEETVYEIISEAQSSADLKHCFVEMSITHKETGKSW